MSDTLDVDPESIAEGGDMPMPDDSTEPPESTGNSFSFLEGTPLNNSEPNEDIEDVDGFRLGGEYGRKYLERGVNKLIQTNTPAWLDFTLAGVNGLYALFQTVGGGGSGGEDETNTSEEPEIKK